MRKRLMFPELMTILLFAVLTMVAPTAMPAGAPPLEPSPHG